MRVCAYCGEATPEGQRRCPSCRAEVEVGQEKGGKGGKGASKPSRCPSCEGILREGFLGSEPTVPWNKWAVLPPINWQSGAIRWSIWRGYLPGAVRLPVQAYRCESCGRLEFYAKIPEGGRQG